MTDSPNDVTLRTYEAAAERYRHNTATPAPVLVAFLEAFAQAVGSGGHVLELGSGPGRDATILEDLGLRVSRTDGTRAFVDMMRADGHDARLLDIRRDDFDGPYDGVLADAVLLHLDVTEFAAAAGKARDAVRDGGSFALTLKEGDGAHWRTEKLDLPRHFTLWRAPTLDEALRAAGWKPLRIDHVAGSHEPWLYALCRTA